MNTFSTAAWVAHDLGLASSFGGSLFGRYGLHPAVRNIGSSVERGKVVNDAWRNYRKFSLIANAIAAGSWLIGRSRVSGRGLGQSIRPLVTAKDALIGGMVATSIGTSVIGYFLNKRNRGYLPVGREGGPSGEMTPESNALVRTIGVLGSLNSIFTAGVIGVTAVLAMQSGRSLGWSVRSRLLY